MIQWLEKSPCMHCATMHLCHRSRIAQKTLSAFPKQRWLTAPWILRRKHRLLLGGFSSQNLGPIRVFQTSYKTGYQDFQKQWHVTVTLLYQNCRVGAVRVMTVSSFFWCPHISIAIPCISIAWWFHLQLSHLLKTKKHEEVAHFVRIFTTDEQFLLDTGWNPSNQVWYLKSMG